MPNFSDAGVSRRVTEAKMNDVVEGRQPFDDELANILRIDRSDERECRLMYLMEFMKHGNFNVSSTL